MSWQFQNLPYSWKIGVAAVLTGTTIFVANNARMYLMQKDAVQIIMGTVERAMATQTGTNSDGSAIYAVSPPTLVRNWVTTNGLTGTNFAWITNSLTNTISFYTDHSFMVSLDSTIKALVPYYCDTSSIYDGTTNISMLTVTGLFASLQIGDHTNQFTAIPCWTNNPGTTNCTTNAATFGPWAWYNYVVAWQERYKVLNALKMTPLGYYTGTNFVSNEAQIWANSYWYSVPNGLVYGFNPVGVSDGTVFNISLNMGASWYGTIGNVWFGFYNYPSGYTPNSVLFYLDSQTNVIQKAGMTLLDPSSKIWNVVFNRDSFGSIDTNSMNILYSNSNFEVDFKLKTLASTYTVFDIYGTASPVFIYATNKYW